MLADLVVDASGRGSSSAAWLECLGYARPKEERVEIGLGYTTRVYRRRGGDLGGKLAVVVAGSGPNWRNGALLFQSEDRWIVSVGGFFGDHAPDDQQLFAAYVRSLPTSDIHDIVAHAEPLSARKASISGSRYVSEVANWLRRKLRGWLRSSSQKNIRMEACNKCLMASNLSISLLGGGRPSIFALRWRVIAYLNSRALKIVATLTFVTSRHRAQRLAVPARRFKVKRLARARISNVTACIGSKNGIGLRYEWGRMYSAARL